MKDDSTIQELQGEWNLALSGWPLWVVVPLAVLAAWGMYRLLGRELRPLGGSARLLLVCRLLLVVLVTGLLTEPSCTRRGERVELPQVAVLVDDSRSMAARDSGMALRLRLDELAVLDAGTVQGRDRRPGDAVDACLALLPELATLRALLEAGGDLAGPVAELVADLEGSLEALAGAATAELPAEVALLRRSFVGLHAAFAESAPDARRERLAADDLLTTLGELRPRLLAAAEALTALQDTRDAAWVAQGGEALQEALAAHARSSRFERACRLVDTCIAPAFSGRGDVQVRRLGDAARRLDPGAIAAADLAGLGEGTDIATPLRGLAERSSGRRLGAVLVVGDGRVTGGGDPLGPARVLAARGAVVGGIAIGDPAVPRDAVVAAIQGPGEVFVGEQVRLDVRFRLTGTGDERWRLVLTRDGREVDSRPVQASEQWQSERFDLPADSAGVAQFAARLEARAGQVPSGGGLSEAIWRSLPGESIDRVQELLRAGRKPDSVAVTGALRFPSRGEAYGRRLQGWLVPEHTGSYRFAVAADDQCQLWLSSDARPEHRLVVAQVSGWTPAASFDGAPEQRSAHIPLRAGEPYWIEVLHKQGSGDDHLSVAWQRDGAEEWRVIEAARLLPADTDLAAWRAQRDGSAGDPASRQASRDNDEAQLSVVVNQDPIRVLVVDAEPRWETRYLVALLERDRRVVVERRYLRTRRERHQEAGLPRDAEALSAWDAIVIGDLRPDELLPETQQQLHDFVAGRGGFLVLLAGPRGMPAAYSLGPMADLLPVVATGDRRRTASRDNRQPLRLAAAGRRHAVTAVLDDPVLGEQLWPTLPPPRWFARGLRGKTGATVLLEGPADGEDGQATPVLALQRLGAGRCAYLGTDETWRWRDRLGDRVHQAFWLQLLRWGLADRLRGSDRRLQVATGRALLTADDELLLRVRHVDADGVPETEAPLVELVALDEQGVEQGQPRLLALSPDGTGHGLWQLRQAAPPEGRWRLRIRSAGSDGPVEERLLVVRPRAGIETLALEADPEAMRRLSLAGGLAPVQLAQTASVLRALAQGLQAQRSPLLETISLWSGYAVLVLLVLLLLGEWLLRKRQGLP